MAREVMAKARNQREAEIEYGQPGGKNKVYGSNIDTGLLGYKKPAAPKPASAGTVTSGAGGGGGAVLAPAPGSVSASMEALTGSGGSGDAAAQGLLNSPSRFRQGIGTRMLPNESASLAALRKVY